MKVQRMHYDRKFKENTVKLSYQRDNINDRKHPIKPIL